MPFGRRPPDDDLTVKVAPTEERKPISRPSPAPRRLSSGPPLKAALAKTPPASRKRGSESLSSEEPEKEVAVVEPRPPKETIRRADTKSITKECSMCHVTETSTWRRDDTGKLICNKCGLRRRKDNRPKRPRKSQVPACEAATLVAHAKPDAPPMHSQGLSIFSGDNKTSVTSVQGFQSISTTTEAAQDSDHQTFATSTDSAIAGPQSTKPAGTPRKTGPRRSIDPLTMEPKKCLVCRTEQSPAWRKDADGNALCNRCMLRQKRAIESANRKYTPRAKPISPRQSTPMRTIQPSHNGFVSPTGYSQSRTAFSSPAHVGRHPVTGSIPIDPQLMSAEGESTQQGTAANTPTFKREEFHPRGMNYGPVSNTAYYPPVISESGFYGPSGGNSSTHRPGSNDAPQAHPHVHQQHLQRSQERQEQFRLPEHSQHQQQHQQQRHQQRHQQQQQQQQHHQNSYSSANVFNQQQDASSLPNVISRDGNYDTGYRESSAPAASALRPAKHYNYHADSAPVAFQPRFTQSHRNFKHTPPIIVSNNSDNALPPISPHPPPLSTHAVQTPVYAGPVGNSLPDSAPTGANHSTPSSISRPLPTSIIASTSISEPNPTPAHGPLAPVTSIAPTASTITVTSSTSTPNPEAPPPPPPALQSLQSLPAPAGYHALLNETSHRPWTPHPNPKFPTIQRSE